MPLNPPTKHDGDSTTQIGGPRRLPVVRNALRGPLRLLLKDGSQTGALLTWRPGAYPGLFYARTADRPDEYMLCVLPELGAIILRVLLASDASSAAIHANSLERQHQEARRRRCGG